MSNPHNAADLASAFTTSLATLIEAAPEGDSAAEAVQSPSRPLYVRESNGWGRKYCEPIELHGEQWLAAFGEAQPIVATGGIVVMVGDRGPGKTQMAAELARGGDWPTDKTPPRRSDKGLAMEPRKTALYLRARDISLEIERSRKSHVKDSPLDVIERLSSAGFLAVDEFQERMESESENRNFNDIMDRRYDGNLPTVIIANMTRAEMFASLGASIVDRARENGKSIEFNWPSYRGAKK